MLKPTLATLALLAWTCCARAESVVVGGGAFSTQTRAAYAGVVLPLPGGRLGDGWSQSLFATGIRYQYPLGGRTIDGTATGLKYGLLRQYPLTGGSLGLGGGLNWHHTGLSPDDPANRNRGGRLRPSAELQWRSEPERAWRSQLFGQYVFGERSHLLIGFVGRRLGTGVAIGPQFSTGGDPNYRVHGAALALEGLRLGAAEVGVSLGAQRLEGGRPRPEVGFRLVFYRP